MGQSRPGFPGFKQDCGQQVEGIRVIRPGRQCLLEARTRRYQLPGAMVVQSAAKEVGNVHDGLTMDNGGASMRARGVVYPARQVA